MEPQAYQNMNREIWRQDMHDEMDPGNYYAPNVFVAGDDGIGIDVGGTVRVRPVREWAKMPDELAAIRAELNAAQAIVLQDAAEREETARLRAELEQARRWSATLWRVVRAYRGYMAGLVRDTSLYMESDDEAWRRHMSDWSEIRRAEQAKQAGEA